MEMNCGNRSDERNFDVPLDHKQRDEIWRYVTHRKPSDAQHHYHDVIDSNNHTSNSNNNDQRQRLVPAIPSSKFSFLSGIHPDLDEALCEIQSPNNNTSPSRKGGKRRINSSKKNTKSMYSFDNDHILNLTREAPIGDTDISIGSCDEFGGNNVNIHDTPPAVGRERYSLQDDKSKENHNIQTSMDYLNDYNVKSSSIPYNRGFGSGHSLYSMVESISSKPKEITCKNGARMVNESIDSLPFSIDGMERAKQRIKSQADKIRDLEAKLEQVSQIHHFDDGEDDSSNHRKSSLENAVLSPEERLRAHKERKRKENEYKEKSGKWEQPPPPPLKHQNLTSKVKRKDDLVDRLAATPTERKRQDELKKKVMRTNNKYSSSTNDRDMISENEEFSSHGRRSSSSTGRIKQISSERRKKKSKTKRKKKNLKKASKMPGLMSRLNMSVKERRGLKQHDHDLPDDLKRTLKGHRLQKKKWTMSSAFDDEGGSDNESVSQRSDSTTADANQNEYAAVSNMRSKVRCETCSSQSNCEEDGDNPGTFYCERCWEEYENVDDDSSNLGIGKIYESDDNSSPVKQNSRVQMSAKPTKQNGARKFDEALWIVHDNPKLGEGVVWSGSNKMSCLVETKDPMKKNCVRILRGTIDFCGSILDCTNGRNEGRNMERGSECIRLGDVCGFVIDHDKVETRLAKNKSIHEFRLDPNNTTQLTGPNAQKQLKDFLHDCCGAVNVILSPHSSPGGWYPLREAGSNGRKVAPQFRSNGVGYIRLGDDMGNNGLAFLSGDSCETFFSTESLERRVVNEDLRRTASSFSNKRVVNEDLRRTASSFSNKLGAKRSSQRLQITKSSYARKKCDSSDSESDEDNESVSSSKASSLISCEESESVPNAATLLKELQNLDVSNVKWKEKADKLNQLGKAVGKHQGRASCGNALNYIQDIISSKNVNINVLRSALLVVGKIGQAMKHELSSHIAWKTILIEILKLLKNKTVSNGAKEILRDLHGKCYTLSTSMTVISHVLGLGKNTTTTTKLRKSMSSRKSTPSNNDTKVIQKANNVEVIEWLAMTTEKERLMKMQDIDPMMDTSCLSQLVTFFLSHESHRDARCRKNALDGLLHTVLYGIDQLEMEASEAMSLCSGLKKVNEKFWNRLSKSVSLALKERTRSKR